MTNPSTAAGEGAPRQRLDALTSMRFFAAFHVVLFHASPWAHGPRPGEQPLSAAWSRFCEHGFSAVSFFFVLSGFILAYNYPPERTTPLRVFFRARFARIYPVYALAIVVALPFLAMRVWRSREFARALGELGLATTLGQAWVPSFWNSVNPPGWSLSVEAFFYLMFPWLAAWLARRVRDPRSALLALTALYAAALLPALAGSYLTDTGIPRTDESVLANALRYLPPLALPEFAFGIVVARIHLLGLVPTRAIRGLALPAAVLLILVLASDTVPYLLLHNGALIPLFGLLILATAQGGWLSRLLEHPWLRLLGEASYSLYLLHLSIWVYCKIVVERSGFNPHDGRVFVGYALVAVALSIACHRWVEEPARRALLRRRA